MRLKIAMYLACTSSCLALSRLFFSVSSSTVFFMPKLNCSLTMSKLVWLLLTLVSAEAYCCCAFSASNHKLSMVLYSSVLSACLPILIGWYCTEVLLFVRCFCSACCRISGCLGVDADHVVPAVFHLLCPIICAGTVGRTRTGSGKANRRIIS